MNNFMNLQITDPSVQLTVIKLKHERQMSRLEVRKLEAENERKRLELISRKFSFGRDFDLEKNLLSRFNDMIQEFSECCQKSTWTQKEMKLFIAQAKSLKGKIVMYCNSRFIEPETLKLFKSIDKLIEFTKKEYSDGTKPLITLDVCDQSRLSWKQMIQSNFDVL